jgi:toxin YoeB
MRLEFEPQAWEDIRHWLQTDAKKLKRILDLIEAVRRDPFQGIGKPEPLKHQLRGAWSRRVDDEHRLVYRVSDGCLIILACRFHY